MTPFDVTVSGRVGGRLVVAAVVTAAGAALALGCLVALATQGLAALGVLYALVIGGVGLAATMSGVATMRLLLVAARPATVARLDHDGLHLLAVGPDGDDVVAATVPWDWVASVSRTTLGTKAGGAMLAEIGPVDVVRFALADDLLLDGADSVAPVLVEVAARLGLTPRQATLVLLSRAGDPAYDDLVAWLGAHRPGLGVVSGSRLPWWAPRDDRPAPGEAVAVVGAGGRLGRHVVDVLTAQGRSVVAIVRNERHRADLERRGAEVRMVDLEQGPVVLGRALQGCGAAVHLATGRARCTVEAALRARVSRVLLVTDAAGDGIGEAAATPLAWTAFRPLGLTDALPTGEVALGDGVEPGTVPRGDLAEVLVASLRDEGSFRDVWPIAGIARTSEKAP